jgi:flavin-dependent dehydrogenase
MVYDIAVVGAGPAGLMAAKTAAEQGLKTVLIEKRREVSKITRACCMQFILDDGYENEYIQLREGKIVFTRNGFEVAYNGPTRNLFDKYYISPGGHKIHFANEDGSPFSIKFDKGVLLQGLWDDCEHCGVEIRENTVAYSVKDSAQGVEIGLVTQGIKSTIKARKLIAADGVNSRMTDALGMNKERKLFTVALGVMYMVEGIRDFEPTSWKTYMGQAYSPTGRAIIAPSWEDQVAEILVSGGKTLSPEEAYHHFSKEGPMAPLFEKSRIVDKVGYTVKAFTSIKTPFKGNVLVIGDAAAFVEVEVQGGLMCGFHAASAVKKELEEGKGFEAYTSWWQESFEFNSDEYLRVFQGYALSPTYTDEELGYLFSLTEDQILEGTYSQYKTPKLMWDSFLRHKEKIRKERPEIFEKIKKNRELTLS